MILGSEGQQDAVHAATLVLKLAVQGNALAK